MRQTEIKIVGQALTLQGSLALIFWAPNFFSLSSRNAFCGLQGHISEVGNKETPPSACFFFLSFIPLFIISCNSLVRTTECVRFRSGQAFSERAVETAVSGIR